MKILAIDFGLKKMGFAIGSTILKTTNPIKQIKRVNLEIDIEKIRSMVVEYDIQRIVIGYPYNMDGTRSEMIEEVERFSDILRDKLEIDVEYVDERLTSFEAGEMLKNLEPNLRKRRDSLDSVSAMIILKNYLEQL